MHNIEIYRAYMITITIVESGRFGILVEWKTLSPNQSNLLHDNNNRIL